MEAYKKHMKSNKSVTLPDLKPKIGNIIITDNTNDDVIRLSIAAGISVTHAVDIVIRAREKHYLQ